MGGISSRRENTMDEHDPRPEVRPSQSEATRTA